MFTARRGALLIHTLSLCVARRHFPFTELVTDNAGLGIAEALGWEYTSILNSLEEMNLHGIPDFLWAAGKFIALLEQAEPCVHVDNDVLLHAPISGRASKARLLAQSIDFPDWYLGREMDDARTIAGLPRAHMAYNCGVIGGTDLRLLHQYATEGLGLARRFQEGRINGTTVSMMIEQYRLGVFARAHEARVETLIPINGTEEDLRTAGYMHLTGSSKNDKATVARAERMLDDNFPVEYRRFLEGWKRISKGAAGAHPRPTFHTALC